MEGPVARQAAQVHHHLPPPRHQDRLPPPRHQDRLPPPRHQDRLLAVDILMGGRIIRLTHQKEPILDLATMVRLQHRTATQALAIAVIGMAFTAETREQTTQKCKTGFTQLQQRSNTCLIK
jgi:hypothetical protein